ncbi:DUF2806 domain-containing protein [Marinomonas fungiae]|uniref:Membrane-fusion protein n=1 Tax=Marinomonas fungiae TaxID=1137284 RepID=A0A0K6IJK4_9GAMM|nr:DUF2806 domain-containing protein [Marinomonas fungiae]CUB03285.1 Protein of unknown function (DUF2806) [Marinomonas fungiae]
MDYPGEKLLLKMWETLAEKGVGSLLAPWQEKRMADARAEIRRKEMLLLAQAEVEVDSIKSGQSSFQLKPEVKLLNAPSSSVDELGRVEPTLDLSELASTVSNNDFSESIRKETNVAKSILIAEDILGQDRQEPSDTPIEDDWLYSWREYAGRVSADELQDLWGRILAGEVKQPGTYSMRTLEFLKGLSKAEAELISKAARFVIDGRIYRDKENFLEAEGLFFSQLLFLQDIGVLSGVEALGLTTTYKTQDQNKYFKGLIASDKIILIDHEDKNKTVEASVYLLTRVGAEVLRLASFGVNTDYLESVAKDYAKKGFNVRTADFVQLTAESGQYFNAAEVKLEENA